MGKNASISPYISTIKITCKMEVVVERKSQRAMWRSKLGTDYAKEYMEKNEKLLLKELNKIRTLPENRVCADCGMPGTVWASVNLGVFLCMTCGAHHRSLGTHISLPKGCTGTYWWGPDEIERMKAIGNLKAKTEFYGDGRPSTTKNGLLKNTDPKWEEYLMDKYYRRRFQPDLLSVATTKKSWKDYNSTSKDGNGSQVDLISFDERFELNPSKGSNVIKKEVSVLDNFNAKESNDFFAEFGL